MVSKLHIAYMLRLYCQIDVVTVMLWKNDCPVVDLQITTVHMVPSLLSPALQSSSTTQ